MTILALDTTGESGSIALRRNGKTVEEAHVYSTDGFAHVVFSRLRELLDRNVCALGDFDCFAAANGPGSFTGVRVGLTVMKGLGEAMNKPVAAVSNLRALAAFGSRERRAVILDARRGEVYAAVYDATLRAVSPEVVTKLSTWVENLEQHDYEFIAAAGAPFRQAVNVVPGAWTDAPKALASAVAYCAELDAANGTLSTALDADANYVRSSDAELFWRDKTY